MQKLDNLKEKLGEKKFEKLMVETAPRAEEIVRKMLEGASALDYFFQPCKLFILFF